MFHVDFDRSRSEYQNESTENVKTRVPKFVNSRFKAIFGIFPSFSGKTNVILKMMMTLMFVDILLSNDNENDVQTKVRHDY